MKAFTVTQHFGVWQENSQTWSRELKNVVTAVFEDDAIINTPSPNEFEIFYNNECVLYHRGTGLDDAKIVDNIPTVPDDYKRRLYVLNTNADTGQLEWVKHEYWTAFNPPFNSWLWDDTAQQWNPPVARPDDYEEVDYNWDDDDKVWVAA